MYSINKQQNTKTLNIRQNKLIEIMKLDSPIFHVDDLVKLWSITNRNTLLTSLKRYNRNRLIHRLYRGFYSLKPANELEPLLLGSQAINSYCYLSGETILAKHGVIFQQVNYFTYFGQKTRRFEIGNYKYYCRQLKNDFLYNDTGVDKSGKFNLATLERAVADILYINPLYHFDNPGIINWKKVKKIQAVVYKQ